MDASTQRSHVSQCMRTLNAIGKKRGYRIVSMIKDACTFTTGRFQHRTCPAWNKEAMAVIIEMKPDLVFAMSTRSTRRNNLIRTEAVLKGYRRAFARLAEHDIPVLGLRDNPWFTHDMAQCVSAFAPDWTRCGHDLDRVLLPASPTAGVNAPNVTFVDFTDLYCADGFCPAVKNGILIYRDRHHLTGTFAYLQKDYLDAAITTALARADAKNPSGVRF